MGDIEWMENDVETLKDNVLKSDASLMDVDVYWRSPCPTIDLQ